MEKQVDPLAGRAAELNEYATSDLSVEEQLAGGASVDDLVAAGVLYDDYDPDNDPAYDFTPEPTAAEMTEIRVKETRKTPMSDTEFQKWMKERFKDSKMAAEYRTEANRRETWT